MLSEKFIAKIEGHGAIHVDWDKNEARLKVLEGERLFEGILEGRTAEETHWITPRICGVCPVAHNLASLMACEDAFGVKPNQSAILLRKLMLAGQIIQSHFLHLFFLALPDYAGIDRGTELNKKNPEAFKMAMELKEISDAIVQTVAGRNVHPTTTTIGGFHKIPAKSELAKLLESIKKTRNAARNTMKLFETLEYPALKVDLEFISQKNGRIVSNKNDSSLIGDYKKDIEEEIKENSTAKFGKYKKREVMVGALARLALLEVGPPRGGPTSQNSKSGLNYQNPFHNNLAQAVEILLYHEQAEDILKQLLESDLKKTIAPTPIDFSPTSDVKKSPTSDVKIGIGAVEAPRGGLYHEFYFTHDGVVTYANIITPTVQNLTSIEKSANALLTQHEKESQEIKRRLLEMLVRAYDPCITCAVH